MPRIKLLILDANVVIALFELGIWERVVESCDIHLSEIVICDESIYYDISDLREERQYIKIDASKVTAFSESTSETRAFLQQFGREYQESLDPGELESLVHLFGCKEPYLICSSDKIVYRVLGAHNFGERGISLQEVLEKIGLSRKLEDQYTKKFREHNTSLGFAEGFQGTAFAKGDKS